MLRSLPACLIGARALSKQGESNVGFLRFPPIRSGSQRPGPARREGGVGGRRRKVIVVPVGALPVGLCWEARRILGFISSRPWPLTSDSRVLWRVGPAGMGVGKWDRRQIMRRRAFLGLGIGIAATSVGGRVAGRNGGLLVASPVASPAAIPSNSPATSPVASESRPVAVASRRYSASNRFAWEQIGAAYLRLDVARFTTHEVAVAAFPGLVDQRLDEAGAAAFAPAEVPAFADERGAWAGFDGKGRPTALLAVREGRDVHTWLARQVPHGGRVPNPAHPLGALLAIARGVFAVPRPEPDTPLGALPGPGDVPAGLELFQERQTLISPATAGEGTPDATPA